VSQNLCLNAKITDNGFLNAKPQVKKKIQVLTFSLDKTGSLASWSFCCCLWIRVDLKILLINFVLPILLNFLLIDIVNLVLSLLNRICFIFVCCSLNSLDLHSYVLCFHHLNLSVIVVFVCLFLIFMHLKMKYVETVFHLYQTVFQYFMYVILLPSDIFIKVFLLLIL